MFETPVYIICLNKTRKKRCDPTYEAWKKVMFNTKRLTAITPTDFNIKDVAHPYAQSCINLKERKTLELIGKHTELACAMSHIKAWKQIIKSNKPSIVVEDDMVMSKNRIEMMIKQLYNIPKDTELYLLHFIGVNLKSNKLENGYIDVKRFTGTQAYYITPQACKKLVKNAIPIIFQVDTYMARFGLKVRSRPENKMSWLKFMKDAFTSTLGGGHISSTMSIVIIILIVLFIMLILIVCVWVKKGNDKKHELQKCEKSNTRLKNWKKKHKN
jgi:GR25 family glycosyltransferase involved in LPS biosynthesis